MNETIKIKYIIKLFLDIFSKFFKNLGNRLVILGIIFLINKFCDAKKYELTTPI